MRKLSLFFLLFLGFAACQRAKKKAQADWTIYEKAYDLYTHQNDSAFYYFNQVTATTKDSAQLAMSYVIMAMIQSDAGDHFGAQESLTSSLRYLDEGRTSDQVTLTNVYNELGMASTNLKHYKQALSYFERANAFAQDSAWRTTILNNKALAYQKNRDYQMAIALYRQLLPGAKGKEQARVLNNLARTVWLEDPRTRVTPDLYKALTMRQKEKDEWGLNASYLSLAAYYEKSRPDSALWFARKRLAIARELKSPDDQLEALSTLLRIGPPQEAQTYFTAYQRLNDSLQTARNAAKNQFALIRYNVERRETENVRLQKDVAVKRYQLLVVGLLGVVIAVGLTWHFRKRRRRLLLEQEMRMSKKVHDGVANGIYQLMSEVEHGLVRDEDELADKLDELYQRSRDISYDRPHSGTQTFDQRLSAQLRAFGGANCHISLLGNDAAFWSLATEAVREHLSYILQELLVNMKKHSHAANVLIKFEAGKALQIHYSDDGIGLPEGVKFGNGLSGTENRIRAMAGKITFEGGPGEGLKIAISIPL